MEQVCEEISLYNGDCYEIIPTFKDKTFDLIVTDPPYKLGNTKGGACISW